MQNETDFSMFDEISRLNNELVTLQRDLAKKNIELERLYAEVKALSMTDSLTGVYNRRGFFIKAEQEVEHTNRYQRPLAVIMFDFDHFKEINDRYGHAIGDQVIMETVQRIGGQLRKVDILGRYGGDEFMILLPETQLADAMIIAERILVTASTTIPVKENSSKVTISLGVAALNGDTANLDALLLCTDQALYQAKARGGNCACAIRV